MKELTRSDFAAACGVVKSALSKAEATGKVSASPDGRIPLTEGNLYYLDGCRYRKIGQMLSTNRMAPGWAVLCAIIDGRRKPLCYYAPYMLDDFDVIPAEHAPDFRLRQTDGRIKIDGQLYESRLVFTGAPPAWLSPEARAVLEGKKPASTRTRRSAGKQAGKAAGKVRA